MLLTTFLTIAWLVSFIFWVIPKRLSFLDHLILWFSCSFVMVSLRTVVSLNLGWVEISEDKEIFLTYIIRRSFIDPMLLLILANIIVQSKKAIWKIGSFISFLIVFIVLEYSLVQFDVIQLKKFNYMYVTGMFILFILFLLTLVYLLRRGGSSHEDYNI